MDFLSRYTQLPLFPTMLLSALVALVPLVAAATAPKPQKFVPPAACPVCESDNYAGKNNGSLAVKPVVPGHVYDRYITIWLENTDFDSAAASATFQKLAAQGILLTNLWVRQWRS